jgi:sugar lactone lactonase YvrE
VYVADSGNHRIQIFNTSGTFLRGWGSQGTGDGQFNNPSDVAIDSSGNVYVADLGNHRIQAFDSSGAFLRKWGLKGSGDGEFSDPYSIALDASGNVFVPDWGNHRVQEFTSSGTFLKKWGSPGSDEGEFSSPWGIAIDSSGSVFVGDHQTSRIQKFVREGGPPGAATLLSPQGNISTPTPVFTWKSVSSASWYYLWVNDSSTSGKILRWYTSEQAGCGSGSGACSANPSTTLAAGAAQWWIQTWNNAGYGPWSNALNFTVSAAEAGAVLFQLRIAPDSETFGKSPGGGALVPKGDNPRARSGKGSLIQ